MGQQQSHKLKQLQHRIKYLSAQLDVAVAEAAVKDVKLKMVVESAANLGAARRAEASKWSSYLADVDAGLVAAQQEVNVLRNEAVALREQLTDAAGSNCGTGAQAARLECDAPLSPGSIKVGGRDGGLWVLVCFGGGSYAGPTPMLLCLLTCLLT